MENSQISYQLNLSQLSFKIYEELLDNDLIQGTEANLYNADKTIIKIAILTLYQIAVLDKDYDRINFKLNALTGVTDFKTVLNNDL